MAVNVAVLVAVVVAVLESVAVIETVAETVGVFVMVGVADEVWPVTPVSKAHKSKQRQAALLGFTTTPEDGLLCRCIGTPIFQC